MVHRAGRGGGSESAFGYKLQEDYSQENRSKCPGFVEVPYMVQGVRLYNVLAKCQGRHDHQVRIKVFQDEKGEKRREIVDCREVGWLQNMTTETRALQLAERFEEDEQRRRKDSLLLPEKPDDDIPI